MKVNTHNHGDLGAYIRFHRERAGLTRQRLAEFSGIGKTGIYDLEHGQGTSRLDTLLRICEVLNIDLTLSGPLDRQFHAQNLNEDDHA